MRPVHRHLPHQGLGVWRPGGPVAHDGDPRIARQRFEDKIGHVLIRHIRDGVLLPIRTEVLEIFSDRLGPLRIASAALQRVLKLLDPLVVGLEQLTGQFDALPPDAAALDRGHLIWGRVGWVNAVVQMLDKGCRRAHQWMGHGGARRVRRPVGQSTPLNDVVDQRLEQNGRSERSRCDSCHPHAVSVLEQRRSAGFNIEPVQRDCYHGTLELTWVGCVAQAFRPARQG